MSTALITTAGSSHEEVPQVEPEPPKDGLQSVYLKLMVPYLLSSIFLFYVALSGNFLDGLFSVAMQRSFRTNRWMKHLFGFLILLFTISFVNTHKQVWVTLLLAIAMYFWFLLTTNLSLGLGLAIVFIMAVGFFISEALRKNYHLDWVRAAQDTDNRRARAKVRTALVGVAVGCFVLVVLITFVGTIEAGVKQYSTWGTTHKPHSGGTPHSGGKARDFMRSLKAWFQDFTSFLKHFLFTNDLSDTSTVQANTLEEHVAALYTLMGKTSQADRVRALAAT